MAYTSVEPNQDLLVGVLVGRWEKPEEQVVSSLLRRHGNRSGVRFAHIKVDLRDGSAVNSELWCAQRSTLATIQFTKLEETGPSPAFASRVYHVLLTCSRVCQELCRSVCPLRMPVMFPLHHRRFLDRRAPAGALESFREIAHMLGGTTGQGGGGGQGQGRDELRDTHLLCWMEREEPIVKST